jgi:AcrR family transcriptional regulator
MSRRPNDDLRKAQIRSAAARVFVRRGYAATRLLDIAREAGLSKGGVYFHYRAKEALFHEIFEHHLETLQLRWRFDPTLDEPADRVLFRLVCTHVRAVEDDVDETRLFNLLATLAVQDPAFRSRLDAVWSLLCDTYDAVLARGKNDGLFVLSEPRKAAAAIVAMVQGLGQAAAADPEGRCPMSCEEAAALALRIAGRDLRLGWTSAGSGTN